MEKVIIWGAGNTGKQAYAWCENKYEVFAFADNDKQKIGGVYMDCNVISPKQVLDYKYLILIASIYEKEILQQLFQMDVPHNRIQVFHLDISVQSMNQYLYDIDNQELEQRYRKDMKEMSIGKLLRDCVGNKVRLDSVSCVTGSSNILDYALLKSLMIKFQLKTYLEIGTYIGDSVHIISEVAERCYSITVPPEHPMSMKVWCQSNHMYDYSNRLVNRKNIIQYLEDSARFDFSIINEDIDLYFIDADHSYEGVKNDTEKVFNHKKRNSFVVWHDFKRPANQFRISVIQAVEDTLGKEEFKNVYVFDNNLCGIYVPEVYREYFDECCEFSKDDLYIYDLTMGIQCI